MFSTYHMATSLAAMVLIMGSFGHVAASSDVSPLKDSPLEYNSGIVESRQLSGCRNSDDALDPTRPNRRDNLAFYVRRDAIKRERDGTGTVCQFNSGDTDLAAMFHKSLPHDDLGQVDEEAFEALIECISSGDFDVCEEVPAGDDEGFLVNPVAGFAINLAGPAATALTIPPAPTLDSAELAAQLAEDYWMALARDVPFSQYGTNEITKTAAENLAGMEGFSGVFGVAMNDDGSIDPLSQLFRANFAGVETGPMISQLLVNNFTFDSLTIAPMHNVFATGIDYMTEYDEWLRIQNGGAPESEERLDPEERFLRNARDLATVVATDTIYTEAFRGTFVLMEQDAISRPGFNGPYIESTRQAGFVTYGISNVMRLLGAAEVSMIPSWYQKWQVHNLARPEALAGTVHNTLLGFLDAPIHPSLLENTELLDRVAAANAAQNIDGSETFLLAQASMEGSPTHPSYPSGHSVQNGAFATVLKAFVGLERGENCFKNPVFPSDDGLELIDYTGDCLTIEGEINKLATNVAIGRQMLGVHYRIDSTEGLTLGETAAIRLLHQELMSYPEENTFKFRVFTGEVIELFFDGTFAIDGEMCSGEVYEGVAACFS